MEQFKDYGLSDQILQAIGEMGFVSPTPIQEKTIPAILGSTRDIIGLAQTGTGKTAGFGLPLVQQIDRTVKDVQALILCPTRELCMQITGDLNSFSKYTQGFVTTPIYGGASIVPQMKSLKQGSHIVVGTPGRTLDMIRRGILKIEKIKWLILDEADEMLNMGFRDDLDEILSVTPPARQTLLFSATMPDGVRRIAGTYMNNPEEISAGKKNAGAANVEHWYYVVRAADRYVALKRLADINPGIYGIVFCRTRAETREVAEKLIADGYNADALHGDLSQPQRDSVMQRFRNRNLQLLIATDVAARGLDVTDLSHIINYNLPDDHEVYIHRSGRTGRAGKSGICMTITHSREGGRIREIERSIGKKFELKEIPQGKEICEKRLFHLIDKVEKVEVDESLIEKFMPVIFKKLEWLDRDELIKHFVSFEFNRFLEYYRNATDLNVKSGGDSSHERRGSKGKTTYTRYHVNLGSKHDINVTGLISLINENLRERNMSIGKIDIQRNFSFFEADSNFEKQLLRVFEGAVYNEMPVTVQVSNPDTKTERDEYRSKREYGGGYSKPKKKKDSVYSNRNKGKGRFADKRNDSRASSGSNRPAKRKRT
ncbi:MAG: DEAD/DEAH box helicase [Bacteroidales bacterium]|nr:DEAD/DEAH box helicase [Bacteroidales bacterium]